MTDNGIPDGALPVGNGAPYEQRFPAGPETDRTAPAREAFKRAAESRARLDHLAAQQQAPETAGRYLGRRRMPIGPIAPEFRDAADYVDTPASANSNAQLVRPYAVPANRPMPPGDTVLTLQLTVDQWSWLEQLIVYGIQRTEQGAVYVGGSTKPVDGRDVRALYYAWCNQVLQQARAAESDPTACRETTTPEDIAAGHRTFAPGVDADGRPCRLHDGSRQLPEGPITEYTSPESVWEVPAEPEPAAYDWHDLWDALQLPDSDMTAVQSWSNLSPGERITRSDLDTLVAAWHADQNGRPPVFGGLAHGDLCQCIECAPRLYRPR